jgi:hypothetical protein
MLKRNNFALNVSILANDIKNAGHQAEISARNMCIENSIFPDIRRICWKINSFKNEMS